MEQERFLSGYCRMLDQSRTVAVELEGRDILAVACYYGSCPYEPNLPLGGRHAPCGRCRPRRATHLPN